MGTDTGKQRALEPGGKPKLVSRTGLNGSALKSVMTLRHFVAERRASGPRGLMPEYGAAP